MSKTNVTATGPLDLLAYVRHAMGETPRESTAILCRRGSTIGATLRVDLKDEHLTDSGQYAGRLAEYCTKDTQATSTIALIYREVDTSEEDQYEEMEDLADTLAAAMGVVDLPLMEAWLVSGGRIYHLNCPTPEGCEWHGAEAEDTATDVDLAFRMIEDGSNRFLDLPEPGQKLAPIPEDVPPADHAEWIQEWERAIQKGSAPRTLTSRAFMLSGLTQYVLRDILPGMTAYGMGPAVRGATFMKMTDAGADLGLDPADPEDVSVILDSPVGEGPKPDWGRVDNLQKVIVGLLPEAVGDTASALECLAAWSEWVKGRGTSAGRIIDRTLARDPEYQQAELQARILDMGLMAGWAQDEGTAWRATRG